MLLEQLVANFTGNVRREMIDGRSYLVAPVRMLREGVLNGSNGPLFYPNSEIIRNYGDWNGMPVVLNHPSDEDGRPISARSPRVIEKFGLGTIYYTTMNEALDAEAWFDEAKTRRLSPEIFRKLIRAEPIEVSTGLFTDNEPVKNGRTSDGKPYVGIARNYRPDHLAILPDKKGACSREDGCGVFVNEASAEDLEPYKLDWDDPVSNHEDDAPCKCKGTCGKCEKKQVENQWWKKLGGKNMTTNAAAVFCPECEGKIKKGKCTKCGMKVSDGAMCSMDHKKKKPTGNSLTLNYKGKTMAKLTEDQREEIIDNLIANEGVNAESPWDNADRQALDSMSDSRLVALDRQRLLAANASDPNEDEDDSDDDGEAGDDAGDEEATENQRVTRTARKKKQAPVINVQPQRPRTAKQWLEEAPAEIRSVVNNAIAFEQRQKDELITAITKNERCLFTKDYLKARSLEELQALATLATNQEDAPNHQGVLVPHFAGQVGFPVMNVGEDFGNEDLDMAPESW